MPVEQGGVRVAREDDRGVTEGREDVREVFQQRRSGAKRKLSNVEGIIGEKVIACTSRQLKVLMKDCMTNVMLYRGIGRRSEAKDEFELDLRQSNLGIGFERFIIYPFLLRLVFPPWRGVTTTRASGTKNVSTTRHSLNRQAVLTSAAMKVNTVKPIMNRVRPTTVFHKTHSPFSKPFNKTTALRTNFSIQKVNTAKLNAVSVVGGKRESAVKPLAGLLAQVRTDSAKLVPLGKVSTVIETLKKIPPRVQSVT
ncbi:hypothetical protein Tco_0702890 [Tanacetum coccineum]|uniref:Uncharacterized protein n=1 Tax=Tanacetum coccineum TaxID=301880 RepID=A0ABQ4XXH7_9ASTR